ncbi:HNH endonuclease [Floridanema evergladense]|uniref:HNH endonuclease n=1 Tax=Floridaenema evergladense BLCC-F167 TaxID=3153639 RepID=A0ABV4WNJ8_9CYAN
MAAISETLKQQIWAEAGYRCEYCRTSARLVGMPLVIDHIFTVYCTGLTQLVQLVVLLSISEAKKF